MFEIEAINAKQKILICYIQARILHKKVIQRITFIQITLDALQNGADYDILMEISNFYGDVCNFYS